MVLMLALFAVVMVLPIKVAADLSGARNASVPACLVASIIAPLAGWGAYRLAQGGFNGVVVAYIALTVVYVSILRVPGRSIIGFAVAALAMQVAAGFAAVSFGLNVGKLALGH
jgi:hypothetical protein